MTETAFTKRRYGKPRRGLIFYFCGWRTPMWLYRPVFLIANLAGYGVHAYSIAEENIASATNAGFLEQLRALINDVESDVWAGQEQGVEFFACFGNSIGSELALACSKQIHEISAVILNTVRGSTSEFLWHAPYGKAYKKLYLEQGYTEAKLYNELKPVEAREDLDKLKQVPILLYYSKADTTIPPHNTELLILSLAVHHIHYQVFINKHLNHFWASTKNHIVFWRWLRFLAAARLHKLRS